MTASRAQGLSTVLVTGSSSGIGLATCILLAQEGWTVVATMRDLERAGALWEAADDAGVSVHTRQLDVTDPDSIAGTLSFVVSEFGHLDAVVNNAGFGLVGTVENLEIEDFRSAMEVNFFGVVQTTKAAFPLLRAEGGRIVTITSVGGVVGQPFNEAYCAAKFAVEGFLESLQPVARTVGVGVSIIEPGTVASEFVRNAGIDAERMLADSGPYTPALKSYLDRAWNQFRNAAQDPDGVARVVLAALTDPDPAFRLQTSERARDFVGVKLADLDGSRVTGMTAGWVSSATATT